jgi:hypothetical protein
MKKDILGKLPPGLLGRLARRKGREVTGDESAEELGRWLLDRYAQELTRAVGDRRQRLVERARRTVDRIQERLGLSPDREEEGAAQDVAPADIPADPALRTATLARVYEHQGMVEEALAIYRDIAARNPGDRSAAEAIARLSGGAAPSKGGDAYEPPKESGQERPIPDLADLPSHYGVDEAVLMMVTPGLMYAFWEVTAGTEERVRAEAGPGRLVLRLLRIVVEEGTVREEVERDLEVPGATGEYFIHDVPADGMFRAAVGILAERFHPMVLTNPAATPSQGPAGRVDEEWMEVDQGALGSERGDAPVPLDVKGRTRLTPMEVAVLKLHAVGPAAYARLTGLDESRVWEMLGRGPAATVRTPVRVDVSSGDVPGSR